MKKINFSIIVCIVSLFFIQSFAQNKEKDTVKGDIEHRFYINNLSLNNKYPSFGTTYFGDDKIVFSAQNEKKARLDLYMGTIDKDGELINVQMIDGVSSKSFESNVAFTKDKKSVYFTRSIYGKKNTIKTGRDRKATIAVFKADIKPNGKWTNITPMPFNSKEYDVGHPTLSSDNTKLFFTSNMPGGFGNADIYFVDILGENNYSKPENMGKGVNSKFKEVFPHIKDNVLYYSSNRPDGGLGGLDIYAVKILGQGKVSRRIHLAPPVNSIADDMSYIYNAKIQRGYFSSNRKGGKGSDDIYSFTETRPLTFDCLQTVSGEVVNSMTQEPLPFCEVTIFDVFGKEVEKMKTEKDGKFHFENLLCSENYKIVVFKKHLGTKELNIITKTRHNSDNFYRVQLSDDFIVMKRGKRMLNIFSIYFDYDSSKITGRAAGQLNKIVATMRKYPNMVIELGAHTDSRGGDAYNLKLSKERAHATVAYIVNQGEISSDRITGDGYGETRLLNHCDNAHRYKCTKAEHQVNRRSEFVIVKL